MSVFASKIFCQRLPLPSLFFAILERLSPFWTSYVSYVSAPGAVEEAPLFTSEKSGMSSSFSSGLVIGDLLLEALRPSCLPVDDSMLPRPHRRRRPPALSPSAPGRDARPSARWPAASAASEAAPTPTTRCRARGPARPSGSAGTSRG